MRDLFDFQHDETLDLGLLRARGQQNISTVRFMDLNFSIADREEWMDHITAGNARDFSYIVTPNVDHVIQLDRRPELRTAYEAADHRICDSRILEKLADSCGIPLSPFAGSDITRALIERARIDGPRIAVVGPSLAEFEILERRYPEALLTRIDAPFMTPGSEQWTETLRAVEAASFDVLLICISFPKQELFAYDLKRRGKARGIGLCVGASVDFLTGKQRRAPEIVRAAHLEWAFRLMSNPVRLWKRYLVDGPKIFLKFWAYRRAEVKAARFERARAQAAQSAATQTGWL